MHERSLPFSRPVRGVLRVDGSPIGVAALSTAGPVGPASMEWIQQREEIDRLLHSVREAAKLHRLRYQQMLREMEKWAVELSLAVARRFLHDQIQAGEFPFEALVKRVVAQLEPRQPITLHMHPDDLNLLEKRLDQQAGELAGDRDYRLVADRDLPRGSCHIQAGELNAQFHLEQQLAELRGQMLEVVAESKPEDEPGLPARQRQPA